MNFKRYHVSKNLFDADTWYGAYKQSDGTYKATYASFLQIRIKPFSADDIGRTFTFFMNISPVQGNVRVSANVNGIVFNGITSSGRSIITFTVATIDDTIFFNYGSSGETVATLSDIMLNTGSSPLPYEPYSSEVWHDIPHYIHNTSTDTITTLPAVLYPNDTTATVGLKGQMEQTSQPSPQTPIQPSECGDLETTGAHAGQYKIPISSASTTTPVYLGEVETTRKIKKLVLTGQEEFVAVGDGNIFRLSFEGYLHNSNNIIVCTHYVGEAPVEGYAQLHNLCVAFLLSSSGSNFLYIRDDNYTSASTFKTYLQQQYANGTPVTVWYVLAEPTTGIVNEPLRKIGDYADSVSGITIPTISGKDSFDVLTTLKPSEVQLTYHGWHPKPGKEYSGGSWS